MGGLGSVEGRLMVWLVVWLVWMATCGERQPLPSDWLLIGFTDGF